MSDDYYDDPPVFFAQGSTHTLTDDGDPPHRLAGLRSVKTAVSLRARPQPHRRPIGFHIPRSR